MGKILGIDLGTTNSCVAILEGGQPKVIENKEGNRTTPSIVAESKTGELIVGLAAKRQAVTNPENTVFSVKRLIGRRWEDEEVQKDVKLMPYEIKHEGDRVTVKMGEKEYTPQEISAKILQKLKTDAEEKLGEKITEAVITVPAYFDDSQRQATKDAGKIAGLDVKRIINEPTAAALAYGFDKKKDEKIIVYDLGGGTFDVSVLEVGSDTVEVRATHGDTHLGGDDFDQILIHWILEEYKKQEGVDLAQDNLALQRLKSAAEKAKIELSSAMETEINEPFIANDPSSGPKHLVMKISRAKLEELCADLVKRTFGPVEEALKDAGMSKGDINEIVLVGGQTRMPMIQQQVEEYFGKKPNSTVNPDEVVAMGAAVQAGVLQGDVKDVLLLDVIPLSLGIETLGGVATKLIERNTTIPTQKQQIFSTAADNQTSVEVHVVQGERELANDNKSLGRFILSGIPPSPRGVPQVEVAFDVDANGILNVTAKDKATNKEQSIRIEASSGLSDDEIQKMTKDAEEHADEDRKKKELIESKNIGETMIYTTEKALKDAEEHVKSGEISQDDVKNIQDKIEDLKKKLEGEDLEAIKKAGDDLSTAAQKIGEILYAKEQEKSGAEAGEGATPGEEKTDDVVDADFEEKTDNESEEKSDDAAKGEDK
ncbi:MAG: molecular chaperone DnaK [Candidatus Kerfeldbacteria bacterium CG15_BIG_FIL_POST_REV_8_21_14_020_45_12]|uniref:Chaperone protein DnaK n=1 Tax=Candidatus Kerfeldbacteria bacterium CG15_BIG_FIL_POST_REV_8_21_14_020_45_12 TaxID=2014247 RepID=A0A2M7H3W1_9BACT|nr:MAG: molecular chaperone DnaK [Candidatus Kerfeldbacteria bacterium CG15_BIG_FIL_POST_REV_8_21_14_020_45_12]PJA93003.1 MAG: molecular chaperone DnaK [Candidatus Kerfeldbacteria bacterium CG_4_9_14_3_um_filter_45_8]